MVAGELSHSRWHRGQLSRDHIGVIIDDENGALFQWRRQIAADRELGHTVTLSMFPTIGGSRVQITPPI